MSLLNRLTHRVRNLTSTLPQCVCGARVSPAPPAKGALDLGTNEPHAPSCAVLREWP